MSRFPATFLFWAAANIAARFDPQLAVLPRCLFPHSYWLGAARTRGAHLPFVNLFATDRPFGISGPLRIPMILGGGRPKILRQPVVLEQFWDSGIGDGRILR
jgi:hypothetical protein